MSLYAPQVLAHKALSLSISDGDKVSRKLRRLISFCSSGFLLPVSWLLLSFHGGLAERDGTSLFAPQI